MSFLVVFRSFLVDISLFRNKNWEKAMLISVHTTIALHKSPSVCSLILQVSEYTPYNSICLIFWLLTCKRIISQISPVSCFIVVNFSFLVRTNVYTIVQMKVRVRVSNSKHFCLKYSEIPLSQPETFVDAVISEANHSDKKYKLFDLLLICLFYYKRDRCCSPIVSLTEGLERTGQDFARWREMGPSIGKKSKTDNKT